jgi:hypothetical protein
MNLLCASAKKSRKGEMLVVAAAQTGANTIMQTETERGHWHAIKPLCASAGGGWAASFFRCVKYLTHWHGKPG